MKSSAITRRDLQVLLDVAEGYTEENGYAAVSRYAAPEVVQRAIMNAKSVMRSRPDEAYLVTPKT